MSKLSDAVYARGYVYNFHFHLIWVTKYRHQTFTTNALSNEMKQILQHIAELNDITIEKVEVMPDHVHLMISFKPKQSATDVIKALKGGSARLFLANHPDIKQKQYWGGNLWSRSYYMGTVGNISKDIVEKYIANQKNSKQKVGRPTSRK